MTAGPTALSGNCQAVATVLDPDSPLMGLYMAAAHPLDPSLAMGMRRSFVSPLMGVYMAAALSTAPGPRPQMAASAAGSVTTSPSYCRNFTLQGGGVNGCGENKPEGPRHGKDDP
jgi:hypothetical protein